MLPPIFIYNDLDEQPLTINLILLLSLCLFSFYNLYKYSRDFSIVRMAFIVVALLLLSLFLEYSSASS